MIAGLTVTYVYNLWSKQAVPDLRSAYALLYDYRLWAGGSLIALGSVSIASERAHRRHEAQAPQPLRVGGRSWWRRITGQAAAVPSPATQAGTMVGRTTELAKLNNWFGQVKSGTRHVIFVSGEPGIGKTTLTRAFRDSLAGDCSIRIGRGQCVEQYGAGEPYMPILEALTRLCREPGGDKLVEILHRLAPAWLTQMPSLVRTEDRARLQGLALGTTQQRMLREMAEALEVISAEAPLLLYLEDLHWSDPSTLDLIATVARRNESARLMILGTYRPVEMLAGEHPLRTMKEELELHQQCIELRLQLLSEADVAMYIVQRFGEGKEAGIVRFAQKNGREDSGYSKQSSEQTLTGAGSFRLERDSSRAERGTPDLTQLASAIYARSEGNPLFMVNVLDYLLEHGSLADANKIAAPRNIRQMIERNLQRLTPDEQRVLEAASVVGAEFSTAAVAAALQQSIGEIEVCCTGFAKREQFVAPQSPAAWPDGTSSTAFRFRHALYQDVLYDSIPESHRVAFHRRIATRLEAAYDGQVSEIAAELSHHYRQARIIEKAVYFLRRAAEQSAARSALAEAKKQLRDAIGLVSSLPDSRDRDRIELGLQSTLGGVLASTSWGLEERGLVVARANELCRHVTDLSEVLPALFQIVQFYIEREHFSDACELADHALELAKGSSPTVLEAGAWYNIGESSFWAGDLSKCLVHCERAVAMFEGLSPSSVIGIYGLDYYLAAATWATLAELIRGRLAESRDWQQRIPARIAAGSHPFSQVAVTVYGVMLAAQVRGDREEVEKHSLAVQRTGEEFGFQQVQGYAKAIGGWSHFWRGEKAAGITEMKQGAEELRSVGSFLASTWLLTRLAEVEIANEDYEDAAVTIAASLENLKLTGERWCEPEVYRLAGELELRKPGSDLAVAEESFREAVVIARKQATKWWELRATTSLARLLRDTGRHHEARTMLAEIYGWFTEGFDTAHLKDAKALLDELGN